MSTEANNTQNTPASNDASSQSQQPESQQPETTISKEEHVKLLEKARADEKAKVYPDLEKARKERTEAEAKIKELEEKQAEQQKEIESLRTGKTKANESFNKELAGLRESNEKLQKSIDKVAAESASRVREFELAAYRERALRESGLKHLTDLVRGKDEAAIDASIKAAKEKEDSIFAAAKEEFNKSQAAQLPTPLSPDGSVGANPATGPLSRQKLARLPRDEYLKERERLLKEAKQKSGLS